MNQRSIILDAFRYLIDRSRIVEQFFPAKNRFFPPNLLNSTNLEKFETNFSLQFEGRRLKFVEIPNFSRISSKSILHLQWGNIYKFRCSSMKSFPIISPTVFVACWNQSTSDGNTEGAWFRRLHPSSTRRRTGVATITIKIIDFSRM